MTYFANVRIRGDVRYYQTLADSDLDTDLGIELGDYDFWRATVGVSFRWQAGSPLRIRCGAPTGVAGRRCRSTLRIFSMHVAGTLLGELR